ncbi:MAG: AAA family ATPase [Planctomycetaceae bacterium]|nr:AAA family ATPase [Planctomycetaceae bacterium]
METAHQPPSATEPDASLVAALARIQRLTGGVPSEAPPIAPDAFMPVEPRSFAEAQLTDSHVESLILKFLLARGDATGRDIADQVKLPFVMVDELLRDLKEQRLVGHRGSAPMNDFLYQLSDLGRERAQRYTQHCTYFGAAPVSLRDYVAGVHAQSLTTQHPTVQNLCEAFSDLVLSEKMLDRLGPAINSGRGLFLYGPPGNGKTCIAERITAVFGNTIWIPRAVGVDGEIVRLFDPMSHEETPLPSNGGLLDSQKIDKRWVRIRRPTIVAGGELTMSQLEVTVNSTTGICEAPLQLKSNCGTLVIDDFGRQRMRIDELLNRWIVPLEKRYDFLNLPNGKKVKVPFDQLVVFSTNLEPRELVDEAFLRRIPYKIEVTNPSEDEFRRLLRVVAERFGMAYQSDAVDHLIATHFRQPQRPLRFCHPRDLLLQVINDCKYRGVPPEMTREHFDRAVENYFAVL